MLSQRLALLAVILTSISAIPTQIAKREVVNDAKGNIKLTFSDETIKLGTITIDEIIKNLAVACSTQGQCDTSPFEITGDTINPGLAFTTGETLTVNPSGSYPTWIHNGLIDALSAAVKAIAECKPINTTPACYGNAMAYCPSQEITLSQCTVPQYWGINFQPPDLGNAAPPFIGADMAIKVDDDGFCGTFTTSLGAVAGAVNGIGGGIFSLLSLACK
ncbi:hypothetical protein MMC31_005592 [Peltigera leucophlebia]|nr:hypothetical protein [Peltigera leucophlebia]